MGNKMKFVIAALLGLAQARQVPIGQLVALNNEIEFDDDAMVQTTRPEDGYYNAWEAQKVEEDKPIDPLKYLRVIPAHWTTGTDDIFMRSMVKTYAIEEKECEHDEDDKPIKDKCKPTGLFSLTRLVPRPPLRRSSPPIRVSLETLSRPTWILISPRLGPTSTSTRVASSRSP